MTMHEQVLPSRCGCYNPRRMYGSHSMKCRSLRRVSKLLAALGVALLTLTGCAGRPAARLLSLIGLSQKPLVLSIVAERSEGPATPLELLNPFEGYAPFNAALGDAIGRNVVPDLVFPFQVGPNLALGICHLAIVSPLQLGQLADAESFPVLAVFADEQGRTERGALLIVAERSQIRDAASLRGKIVAFGPAGDARTHQAALRLLAARGLQRGDLSLEPLPIPGSLKHFAHMRAVAQSVMNGSSDAGFIDEHAWETMPEHSEREGDPCRAKLRVIDRAAATPERIVIASPTLDAELRSAVQEFLMSAGRRQAAALSPLKCSGFQAPEADLIARCREIVTASPAAADGQTPTSTVASVRARTLR